MIDITNQEELRRLESLCIQEYAPQCTAACPVHVDVRSLTSAIAKGNFQSAVQVFSRSVPFPEIISRVCDHPCERLCKRGDVGEPIAVRALERAALSHASPKDVRTLPIPKKNQRIAVIGAGLSGLTAAHDLARKGYDVTVFERARKIGGSLWNYPTDILPESVIQNDFNALERLTITFCLGTYVSIDFLLSEVRTTYDAVYIGAGRSWLRDLEDARELPDLAEAEKAVLATGIPGIFAGGTAVYEFQDYSPITSISHGRRAAISIDRHVQKVSLTASRENEGPYETRLVTCIEGIEHLPRISLSEPSMGYTAEEAGAEARRCLQCECMECVKVCEYLAEYKAYPRKYVRQIYNNLSIVMGQRHGNRFINSCSLCGLCKEVCPESLDMGEVCKAARNVMVSQGKMPPSAHEFALRDMDFSNSERAAFARHQPGFHSSTHLFFPGCQLAGLSPDNVEKSYTYLTSCLQGGVGLMLGCCGAPADWAGRSETFSHVMNSFRILWREMGGPRLILACSSCHAIFKSHLPEAETISLWEIFDQYGLPGTGDSAQNPIVLAIHDPCSSRDEADVQQSVRNLARRLGIEISELPLSRDKTECCSFGGLMYFANRQLAHKVMRRRISETQNDLLVYCAVCCDHFRSMGKPTLHLLDLIFGDTLSVDAHFGTPDYSQKRENRVRLKNHFLGKLWAEKDERTCTMQTITLTLSDETRELMAQRMILVEDIEQVIRWAENSGHRLVNRKTGHLLAHHCPGNVTYWVEYSISEDGFTVHNAYSHRMEILEELRR